MNTVTIASSAEPFGAAFAADWERACRDDAEWLGHFPMTENPEVFLEYLRPALARLRTRH